MRKETKPGVYRCYWNICWSFIPSPPQDKLQPNISILLQTLNTSEAGENPTFCQNFSFFLHKCFIPPQVFSTTLSAFLNRTAFPFTEMHCSDCFFKLKIMLEHFVLSWRDFRSAALFPFSSIQKLRFTCSLELFSFFDRSSRCCITSGGNKWRIYL